ncbi:hypothetical protein EBR57_11025 [bacterium]|nr:hypothetical protein [bacterium]
MHIAKRFLIAITLTFTGATLGIWLVGYLNSPEYTASKAARYVGTPDQIVAYLSEVDTGPSRRGEVAETTSILGTSDGTTQWDQTTTNGAKINYHLVSENVSKKLTVGVTSASFGMTVTWNYTITPVSETVSEVNIEELLHIQNSWIRGIMVVTGRDAQLKQEHRHLADRFELGI